jgi:hypothetical protein
MKHVSTRGLLALTLSLTLLTVSSPAFAAKAPKPSVTKIDMKYEGGSLELNQHDDVDTYVAGDTITSMQGKKRFSIPTSSITEVSYGNDVHRRVGAAIGVGVLTLGIGAMLMFVKTKKHYVGITWTDEEKKGGSVFKVGKGEYRGFIKALEGVTGVKAVNADTVGSGGTSKS